MISAKQIGLIHVAAKQLALPEDTYRAILRQHGGVGSAGDLDPLGFERVMAYFNALGFRSTWMRRTYGERRGMASPRQVNLIRHLWRDWSGGDDEAAIGKWLDGHFGVAALRFVTSEVAQKAITALRQMARRKAAKAA